MSNFTFTEKIIKLTILGEVFKIKDDKSLNDKLVSFGQKMQEKANSIKETDDYNKVNNELCNDSYRFLDNLLGQGASKRIFKNRGKNIEDCMELIYFIKEEIENQKESRMDKYSKDRISKPQDHKRKKK